MALKFKYGSRDEVPAEYAPLYAEREGAWCLEVEGASDSAAVAESRKADKAKLDEAQKSSAAFARECEELRKRFEGIDPDEVRKLAEEKQRLVEEQQIKAGEVEKVLESRIKGVKADLEKQVATLTGERDALHARLTSIQVDQAVVSEATKRGLRPTAGPDIMARARNVFRLVNGMPVAFEGNGETARAGKDGVTPMTLAEWIDEQVSEAPHLFEANAGGGAGGNGAGGIGANRVVRNPFRKETWNLTEQMRLEKTDPGLAARLKAGA